MLIAHYLTKEIGKKYFKAQYNGDGGRRSEHVIDLVDFAQEFTHILVIVGDNDLKTQKF